MAFLPQPFVDLVYEGRAISGAIGGDLISFDWTDNLHGKADEIAVELADRFGRWRGPWRPSKGDHVSATIGYLGGASITCGTFTVDIPDARGARGNETLSFRAVSAPHGKALRTQRSQADDDTDLRKIITERAGRSGFGVFGDIDPVAFKYKRQRREPDLGYVRRLAEDYGHFVSIKSGRLVFHRRDQLEAAGPVMTFDIADLAPLTDWSAREQEHGTCSRAKVRYLDPDRKELVEGQADDGRVTNGDTLVIDERVENEGQAEKLARGRLAMINQDWRTAQITVIGSPLMVAGQVVALGATFGKYAGNYLVHVASHSVRRASWNAKLDLKGIA